MRIIVIFFCSMLSGIVAQGQEASHTITSFVIWKPLAGHEDKFESGYKRHLQWHKAAQDPWSWYGWYFVSGERYGQFMDATFDHAWADFDKPIKPADDLADNRTNVFPYGEVKSVYKALYLPSLSIRQPNSLTSKLLRFLTVHVTDVVQAGKLLEGIKGYYQNAGIHTLLVYQVIDGGDASQLHILVGARSFEELGKTDNFIEILQGLEQKSKQKVITDLTSETLLYRSDMSLLPE